VLDDVVDKEAGPKPKLVTPTPGVGSVVRHIPQDELDAYISGRLAGPRLDFCRTHLDSCDECRAELEDLRTFKANAVGLSQASSLKRELERRQRERLIKTAATGLIAAAVVLAIGMVGWNKFGKGWMHGATTAVAHARATAPVADRAKAVAQPRAAIVSAQTATTPQPDQSRGTSLASAASTALPTAAQSRGVNVTSAAAQSHGAVPARAQITESSQSVVQSRGASPGSAASNASPAVQSRIVAMAAGAQARVAAATAGVPSSGTAQTHGAAAVVPSSSTAQTRSAAAVVPAASTAQTRSAAAVVPAAPATTATAAAAPVSTSFALLGPFGDEVTDDRPEFAWQPLAGATKYSIIIVDEGLRPIAHTRLKTTTWRPKKPLRRGRSYLWQVTAILKNGTKVMATGPTSQEARIHIGAPAK
jgi:hypothetical protein